MKFLSNENLMLSYRKAKKSRKTKQETYLWDRNMEENLLKLLNNLKNRNYKHGDYKKIILFDSKKRYIHSPFFRDHIVHHMIHNILYPVLDRKMITTTYACRKGYGAHKAIRYLQDITYKINKDSYYLKLDISKYFYSINHDILKKNIFKIFKDEDLRYTINVVIDSYRTGNQFDNLFDSNSNYIKNINKGLPIGSILSQLLANFYLHKLDHYIKHVLKIKYYLRYMDDILILGNIDELRELKKNIINFAINELDLVINPYKISFNPIRDGINFVGYKIYNSRIFVGKNIIKKTNRFLDNLSEINSEFFTDNDIKKISSSLNSRLGSFFHCSNKLNYFKQRGNIDFHSRR